MKLIISVVCSIFAMFLVKAQGDKTMTSKVYGEWNEIKNTQMSDDGRTVAYTLNKEIGDKKLNLYRYNSNQTYSFDRVANFNLHPSGKYLFFTKKLAQDSLISLQRKKTAKDKFPLDTLVIFNSEVGSKSEIPHVLAYNFQEKITDFIIYSKKDTVIHKDSTSTSLKNKKCMEDYLVIRNLYTEKEDTLFNTKDYSLARDSAVILYSTCLGDSSLFYNVYRKNLKDSTVQLIADSLYEVKSLSLSHSGDQWAFLYLKNKSTKSLKPYEIFVQSLSDSLSRTIDLTDIKSRINSELSSHKALSWSESGQRLFFGIQPLSPEKDSTLLDNEIVELEIWHYNTPRHYPQLNASLDKDKTKTMGVLYDFLTEKVILFEDEEKDKSQLSQKGDGRYILQINTKPHEKSQVWEGELRKDIYLLDTESGQSQLISIGESGQPKFSPMGNYVYWWSRVDSIWKTLDVKTKVINYVGLWNYSKFHDELNDMPLEADPYGMAGWLEGDTAILVYDRYDIWELKPNNPFYYNKLTSGREEKEIYRYLQTDKEEEFISTKNKWLLHKINEKTKSEAYVVHKMNDTLMRELIKGDFWLSRQPRKSKNGDKYIFTKESFQLFPDLLLADENFQYVQQISNANPQQKDYKWGHAELLKWSTYSRKVNEGMVFYPPNFDPERKYPLIVNFYERSAESLHRHRPPMAHRSTINYTYYTNNDYIIFNPDIQYTTGQPGEDCFDAVESGVDVLVKKGYIDESRIALQGHSWGGYQVAYLLTKTDRYRCAESGAPVVNMVSAYGGIRWETGLSRMFQYEKTQSRLGATLWENPELYHKNSPIYNMDRVTTPVLIMHNDNDGHVPWYQGIEYFMALRRLNKPAWLLNYKGEPHWPLKWQNRLDFNIRMQEFFDHYLKDKPMPEWMKNGGSPMQTIVRPMGE